MPPESMDMTGLEEEILTSIRRIVRAIELYSHSLVSQVGLTSPQLSVLKSVDRLSPATPTAIARQLSLSQPTASGILERLQAKNLVTRAASNGDKRMHSYALTNTAREQMASSPPLLQESFEQQDDASSSKYGGTGIELALGLKFSQLSGGGIVQSDDCCGVGNCLTIPDMDQPALAKAA